MFYFTGMQGPPGHHGPPPHAMHPGGPPRPGGPPGMVNSMQKYLSASLNVVMEGHLTMI